METENATVVNQIMSPTIGKLADALAKAQGVMHAAAKDGNNPFYNNAKFASLTSVWDSIRGPLSTNGLSVVQLTSGDTNSVEITTVLLHTSGEWIKSKVAVHPVKKDPQGMGSAITYGRRYSLSAIVGVVADDDDDGNSASAKDQPPKDPPAKFKPQNSKIIDDPPQEPRKPQDSDILKTLTKDQKAVYNEIVAIVDGLNVPSELSADLFEMTSELRDADTNEVKKKGARNPFELNYTRVGKAPLSQAEYCFENLSKLKSSTVKSAIEVWKAAL